MHNLRDKTHILENSFKFAVFSFKKYEVVILGNNEKATRIYGQTLLQQFLIVPEYICLLVPSDKIHKRIKVIDILRRISCPRGDRVVIRSL